MKRRCFIALLSLAAAGCAAVPPRPPAEIAAAWEARRTALAHIDTWDMRGRMSLRAANESVPASVHWRRRGERHDIDLTGPLGGGHVRLSRDAHGARLHAADGRVYRADDPEELLYRATQWRVPLAGLNYWVLGLPAPDVPATEELDEHGRLRALRQLGWTIEFLSYAEQPPFPDLPSKMYLTRRLPDAAAQPDVDPRVELRLIIHRWDLIP